MCVIAYGDQQGELVPYSSSIQQDIYYTSIVNCSRINTAMCVFVFLVPHCATQIQMEIHMLSWAHSLFLYLHLQTFNLNQMFLHDQSN